MFAGLHHSPRLGVTLALLLALPLLADAQNQPGPTRNQLPTLPSQAIAVRCVNTLGTAFEACGGGGAAGTDVNISGVGGVAVAPGGPISVNFTNTTLAVTGTFFQATQPVSGTFWQATQPVSLASVPSHDVTNAGTFAVQCSSGCAAGTPGQTTMANSQPVVIASDQSAIPVTGTFWQTTQPVSLASVPAHNVLQNTASNLKTEIWGGGKGTTAARVLTVFSLDADTNYTVTEIAGTLPAFAAFPTVKLDQTTTSNDVDVLTLPSVTIGVFPDNEPFNVAQYGGTSVVNGGVAGLVGIGGNVAHDGVDSGNPVKIGCRAISATPTPVSAADRSDCVADLAGNLFITEPIKWTCALEGIAASLTECKAAPAAGYSLYVTSVTFASTTGTAGTAAIRSGTGSNCGTTTTGVLPGATTSRTYTTPTNVSQPYVWSFPTGLKLTAAHALCAIGVATNTLNITMAGYTAP